MLCETLQALGLRPNEEALGAIRDRIRRGVGGDDLSVEQWIEGVHRLLSMAPSVLLAAALEDAFAVSERPNVPGAPSTWPNWSVGLPKAIESLEANSLAHVIAGILGRVPAYSHKGKEATPK